MCVILLLQSRGISQKKHHSLRQIFREQNLSLLTIIYYYTGHCTLANHYTGKVAIDHEKNQDRLVVPKECQKCPQQWREVDGVLKGGRKEKELHWKVVARGGQPGGEKG